MSLPKDETVQYGDTVIIIGKDRKPFLRTVRRGRKMQLHFGEIDFDALVGLRYGDQFRTKLGHKMYVLAPSTHDMVVHIQRITAVSQMFRPFINVSCWIFVFKVLQRYLRG